MSDVIGDVCPLVCHGGQRAVGFLSIDTDCVGQSGVLVAIDCGLRNVRAEEEMLQATRRCGGRRAAERAMIFPASAVCVRILHRCAV